MKSIFCTAVVPTVGRESLARAVRSILDQTIVSDAFEVIVVNDSYAPLPPADWQSSDRVQVIATKKRERSVARNTGAALARGQFLHFLDDDDWLSKDAYANFRDFIAKDVPQAAWYYGQTQLVSRTGQPILHLAHGITGDAFLPAMAGEWIPLQSSLIATQAFFKAGGFNPQLAGPEDIDLLRRISLSGAVTEVPALAAFVSWGQEESTTDYARHPQASRWAREQILVFADAFGRLRGSATTPAWQGRMLRLYLTSAIWNLQRGRLLDAGSRLTRAAHIGLLAGRNWAAWDFWTALSTAYASPAFNNPAAKARPST